MVTAKHKHFPGQLQLHGKQIGHNLEAVHSTINVIAQEQKVSRRQTHPQSPQIITEEMQI
jgi:hypothetical protein